MLVDGVYSFVLLRAPMPARPEGMTDPHIEAYSERPYATATAFQQEIKDSLLAGRLATLG